ncbi:MAG: HYC_CC_PP family protein [Flavobacterium sp.]
MKFQKHISILLAIFLLVSNVGFAFNVHYCGDEVASVDTVYLQLDLKAIENGCSGEKVEKESNCCRNITFHFQEKSENTLTKSISFDVDSHFLIVESNKIVVSQIVNSTKNSIASYHYEANVPPFFKLYHQYIFYD